MGIWTKKQRDLDKQWVLDNTEEICKMYLSGSSILELQGLRTGRPIGRGDFERVLTSAGIVLRGAKRTAKMKEKVIKTCTEKFGVANPSSCPSIKQKRANTFLAKYGVENPFQSTEVKEKIIETNLRKYGHQNYGAIVRRGTTSKLHLLFSGALDIAQIPHDNEVLLCSGNRAKSPMVDIVVANKVAVEIFGDYYHANPIKYSEHDKIRTYGGFVSASDIWDRDAIRIARIEKKYPVLVIWEYEIKTDLASTVNKVRFFYENHKN